MRIKGFLLLKLVLLNSFLKHPRVFAQNFGEKHGHNFVFPQNDRQFPPKIAIFRNLCKILAKTIQYRIKNIYENDYYDEISNCFPKDYARKTILMDKFVKNFDFCPHFGDIRTKNWR